MDRVRETLQAALGSAYTIERELGGGGMSRMFVADEAAHGRKVVVKLLPPDMLEGVSLERFKREIVLAARLQHPHIVPLLTSGHSGASPYYVMPLVRGTSLRERLDEVGRLDIGEATSILRDVAKALAYAHDQGVVHRDIKPDNVMVSSGSAIVTDFGVAKAITDSRGLLKSERLTAAGIGVGTPTHMSPEQAAGEENIDGRADIYAFGCMAYELLAGDPPFTAALVHRVLSAHRFDAPRPITELRPDTPRPLAGVVMRCLEKDRALRPQHAADLVAALESLPAHSAQPLVAPNRSLIRFAAGAVVVLAGAYLLSRVLG